MIPLFLRRWLLELRNGETIHRPSLQQLGIILGIMYLFYMLALLEAEFPDVPMGQHAGDSATMAPIQLTSDERAFIRAHPGIRV